MHESIHHAGACVGTGADFFSEDIGDQRAAQSICMGCPVRLACLETALADGAEFGVWGGVIFWDGTAWLSRRGRGRPRKGESAEPVTLEPDQMWEMIRSA